ncbi:PAQR family membrane homeostasis protein TrhA [Ohtaekwangia koreensis]|uniref:Hemolysin III n=1 Tax=Ohtaekwangia koreensis TaxID=688867 RepID=A0A1T5MCL1_9BACT|nr:hemolysin III family protein [Ohtaekwangia koreensis]SKC85724.1 hemolysin III [Ohtaekwangia koreensis]
MGSAVSTRKEELANAITHGLGAVLAMAGLVLLIVLAVIYGSTLQVVSFTVFGATMVMLYLASTLYHSIPHQRAKVFFRKVDHMSIFLLIAGTYTPFCLSLHSWIGWTMFGLIWGCALVGIVLKAFFTGKKELLSTILYVVMGWLGILIFKQLYDTIPFSSFVFLILGGVFYTAGTFFFIKDKTRYFHSIWHLFVLAGSTAHFFSVIGLLG